MCTGVDLWLGLGVNHGACIHCHVPSSKYGFAVLLSAVRHMGTGALRAACGTVCAPIAQHGMARACLPDVHA